MTTRDSMGRGRRDAETAATQGSSVPEQTDVAWGEPTSESQTTEYRAGAGAHAARRYPADVDGGAGIWPAFFGAGLGCLALGIILLAWPNKSLKVVAILIGLSLIVAGLLRLIHGFTDRDVAGGRRAANVVIGLLAGIIGIYCLKHHNLTLFALAFVVGVFWVIHGVSDIASGLFGRGRGSSRALLVFLGLLSLTAGVLVLVWPSISLVVLFRLLGIWLIVYGLLTMVMGFMFRRSLTAAANAERQAARLAQA